MFENIKAFIFKVSSHFSAKRLKKKRVIEAANEFSQKNKLITNLKKKRKNTKQRLKNFLTWKTFFQVDLMKIYFSGFQIINSQESFHRFCWLFKTENKPDIFI